ncbi:MAG TPA: Amuc_1099 family pilus-like system protein [Chthoniobacterales bacterium]|nr:Amuc_1099 family pilus-like system protein [Chthoniobacterales bacterium]
MSWIRANYDRAALLVTAFFLVTCASFIFVSASGFGEKFDALRNVPPSNRQIPSGQGPEIVEAMQKLRTPSQWISNGRSGLFVPEKHFVGPDGRPVTLQNTLLHPPVPNEWLEELGLPITDADVLTQDPDHDGFANLDEWEGHANPTDKESHPPYTSKLKLRSFAQEAFPLIFASSVGDTYAINSVDRQMPTQFLQIGELVAGTKYKLADYAEKYDTNKYGTAIDVSELTLEQVDSHDRVTLVKERRTTSPESVANFLYTWGGAEQSFAVRKDQEFSLKPLEQIKYKLLDVQPDKAVIIDTQKPNEKIEIGPVPRPNP